MLKYVNRINKKLIYKLHLENDKIIDMPMFLVDNLYIRNKEELICLLKHAINFNTNDFLYNYKRVLLKDDTFINHKFERSVNFDKNGIENENYTSEYIGSNKNMDDKNVSKKSGNNSCVELEINKTKCDDTLSNIINDVNINKSYNNDYIKNEKKKKNEKNEKNEKKISPNLNPYKYDNEEYNELINCLSEINEYDENYNSKDFYFYENILHLRDKEIVEDESKENYIQYFDNRKKIKDKNIKSEKIDFSILEILGKEYINKIENDKKYNYKNTIKLLNIFIKLSYKKNEIQYIIKKLLKNLYMCIYSEDLKIATLHF
ncbi:hypothetical protein, partial [Plasmodium yoelii yoelii]